MKISVIVCTYNRGHYILDTIDAILNSLKLVGGDSEVIIIDNNSTDNTSSLLLKYNDITQVKYVKEGKQGLSHARNRGIMEAKGEILVYLDDDIDIKADYFTILQRVFEDNKICFAGGKVLPYNTTIPEWLPKRYNYLVSIFDLGDISKTTRYIMGGNCAIRRTLVDKVGLYNITLGRMGNNLMAGEENEYMDRVSSLGYEIYYVPELTIYHKINDKLNRSYVYNYAYQNGRSNALQYYRTSKLRYFLKKIEQLLLFSKYLLRSNENEEKKIGKFYAMGYLGVKRTNKIFNEEKN